MNLYSWLWIAWIAAFFAIETPALLNSRRFDTLSEHLWWWFGILRSPRSVVDAEKLMERESHGYGWVWVRRMIGLFFVIWFLPHIFGAGWV